ncbi:MAG TPA: neutral/alkaline non-lysosomal ceramidase C-terminal domain-containing protein, partial [Acidimicrobiales bacterium]|nr:neutral/alkaline non-lysosomal ceramidase C-terminal domain-containing protein [Acidimicrobiales bacterium]
TPPGRRLGDVLLDPYRTYRPGQQARAAFVGAYPHNRVRRGDTYLAVEREVDHGWERVADDGDWSTKFTWCRRKSGVSEITVTWDIPPAVEPGTYRIRYTGDARDESDPAALREIDSATRPFEVMATPSVSPTDSGA